MTRIRALAAISALALSAGAAQALPANFGSLGGALDIPRASAIREGGHVLAPMGFVRFCIAHASECAGGGQGVVEMTAERWATLQGVNRRVNASIRVRPDVPGDDRWELNQSAGDCDEYAVQKRHELASAGFPISALSLAVVRTGGGEAHLVLVVRSDRGDFVLDNLRQGVLPWTATRYAFLRIQSAANVRLWVAVGGSAPAGMMLARAEREADTAEARPRFARMARGGRFARTARFGERRAARAALGRSYRSDDIGLSL